MSTANIKLIVCFAITVCLIAYIEDLNLIKPGSASLSLEKKSVEVTLYLLQGMTVVASVIAARAWIQPPSKYFDSFVLLPALVLVPLLTFRFSALISHFNIAAPMYVQIGGWTAFAGIVSTWLLHKNRQPSEQVPTDVPSADLEEFKSKTENAEEDWS